MDSSDVPSTPHSSGFRFTSLQKGENSDLEADYNNEFLNVMANSFWTEGNEGWSLEPIKDQFLFEKSLSLAQEVSNDFYLLAAAECRILSNKDGDIRDLKACVHNNCVRGQILCLRKLLEDHFRADISQYHSHANMYEVEDLVEEMLREKQISTETLFYCWNEWKNHVTRAVESLAETHQAIDNPNEYVQFSVNYLGVQKVENTWYLLHPEISWLKQVHSSSVTKKGRLVSIEPESLITFSKKYWQSELISVSNRVFKILRDFHRTDADQHPVSHQFSTFLHSCDVVRLLKFATEYTGNAFKRLEKYTELLIAGYLEYMSPLGWNAKMDKDMVILRKSQACADIVEAFFTELCREYGKVSSNGQLANVLVMMFGAPKLKNDVCRLISFLVRDEKPWRSFTECMRQFDTGESAELDRFMLFYKAVKNSSIQSWIQEDSDVSPTALLYLIERLLLLTSLLKDGVIYTTKSTMIEWLIQHDKESLKKLNKMTRIDPEELEEVHQYLGDLLLAFSSQNPDLTKEWTRRHGMTIEIFVERIVVAACMLHLSSKKHLHILETMLGKQDVSHVTSYLDLRFWSYLSEDRSKNHIGVRVVAKALQSRNIKNPLVIATLRNDSLDIVCLDTVPPKARRKTKVSVDPNSLWDWLDTSVADPNNVFDCSTMRSLLKSCIDLVTKSLKNPLSLESQNEMRDLAKFVDDMKDYGMSLSSSDSVMVNEHSQRIVSRKSKVEHILNRLFEMRKLHAAAELEAEEASRTW